jgi:hypothetical protein
MPRSFQRSTAWLLSVFSSVMGSGREPAHDLKASNGIVTVSTVSLPASWNSTAAVSDHERIDRPAGPVSRTTGCGEPDVGLGKARRNTS